MIEWDVDGPTPRDAAQAMWDNIMDSDGPVIALTDHDGRQLLVDLGREPGDHDVSARTHTSPSHTEMLLTQTQITEWVGRPLSPEEMQRLRNAVPSSSIPDAIGTIVEGFTAT